MIRKIIFLLTFIVFVSLITALFFENNNKFSKSGIIENNENTALNEFKTFTSAVCEEKEDFVHCKDELFVNCNGKVSKASETKDCNGFDVFGDVTGFAVFERDWKDPRE